MTPDHDTYSEWDAAYLLGALTPADRHAYERHLEDCDACRAAVADLASVPGLLAASRAVVEDGLELPVPPAGLLDRVTARHRRRRTRVVFALAAAAVIVAAGITVPLVLAPPAPVTTVALEPVAPTALTATLGLSPAEWGTRIRVDCDYPAGDYADDADRTYVLVVIDESGEESPVSTWAASPGDRVQVDAGTAVPLDAIAALEVRTADGTAILSADRAGR